MEFVHNLIQNKIYQIYYDNFGEGVVDIEKKLSFKKNAEKIRSELNEKIKEFEDSVESDEK